jgi:MOSC domain-containing protein YiiM
LPAAPNQYATVEAVSRSSAHGFSKQPQPSIHLIPGEGVEGDAHRGVTVQHLYLMRRDPTQPNLCQVHLFCAEMLDELAAKGFPVAAGDLGENILTRGLNLLSLPLNTQLHLGDAAIVEVTGLRTPCTKIDDFRPGLQQHLWGERDTSGKKPRRAGIMSIVLHPGEVRPNDHIRIELPPQPHTPLGPV